MNRSRYLSIYLFAAALASAGCGVVPTTRLDDAKKVVQALRSENSQLKDRGLRLADQNRDLADRAVDDAQRIHTLEESVGELQASVDSYQREVQAMRSDYARMSRLVRAAVDSPPRAAGSP